MDLSKFLTERILLDTAVILSMVAAMLYGFGIFFAEGIMSGYGLSSELLQVDFKKTMLYGVLTLIFAPFKGSIYWVISLAGLVPFIMYMRKQVIPVVVIYFGFLFFVLLQFIACLETGKQWGMEERTEIANAYKGNVSEDFDFVKAKVLMNKSNNKQTFEEGYSLDVPGDYFVLVQPDKLLVIRQEHIVTIEYEGG